jgi:hypothetical protein
MRGADEPRRCRAHRRREGRRAPARTAGRCRARLRLTIDIKSDILNKLKSCPRLAKTTRKARQLGSSAKRHREESRMSKAKALLTVFLAALALSAAAAASTSAATAGWMVGGTQLTGSAALASTAAVDETIKLTAGGVEIECTGVTADGISQEIKASNKGAASSIGFTGCQALTRNCALSSNEIGTVPVVAEATLEGTLAITSVFVPKGGTILVTFRFEGEACSIAGLKAATGKVITSSPVGQDEHTLQLASINTAATEAVLRAGNITAKLSGSALAKLTSGLPWSFL